MGIVCGVGGLVGLCGCGFFYLLILVGLVDLMLVGTGVVI